MKKQSPVFDAVLLVSRTARSRQRVERLLQQAKDIEADAHKEQRIQAQRCKACYYFPVLAGQAITYQSCACCGGDQVYSSTATDVLCLACAQQHGLCKHCGGDLEMNIDRSTWPDFGR